MRGRKSGQRRILIERSSGNVFADLGFANADEELAKAEFSRLIRKIIEKRGWTQRHAAAVLGVAPPDVSDLVRGSLARFSQERLSRFLLLLDMDVTIRVAPKRRTKPGGRMAVLSSLEALKRRGRRSSGEKYLAVLDAVPDAPARPGDEMPAASRVREKASAYRPKRHRLKVKVVAQPDPDPVIEAYKRDVDQTLLIDNLRKTPGQRVQVLEAMARLFAETGRARRVAERKR
jgi:predicted XRE-type DNA-binding protein